MKYPNRMSAFVALSGLLFAASVAAPAFADITLTATTGTGIMYGLAKELVYSVHNNQPYTESELDWDIKPLIYTKAALALSTSEGFVASLDVRLGIPAKAGSISDSDWLNVAYNGDTTKTNYSQHDAYSERAIILDSRVGWDVPVAGWLTLEPFLAFGFMDLKWTARDGYLQYPNNYLLGTAVLPYPDSSTDAKMVVSGVGIIYEQTYFIPAVGIAAKLRFGSSFSGSVSFAITPIVFCNDVDNHEFAGNDFYDNMMNGLLLEPKVSFDWQVMRNARLSLDVSYRHIGGLIGTTNVVAIGPNKTPGLVSATYPGGAGASFDALDASVSLVWSL